MRISDWSSDVCSSDLSLSGRLRPLAELEERRGLPTRTRVFQVPPRVLIDNRASNTHTVVEVNGRDRPGLLHAVTHALTAPGLQRSRANRQDERRVGQECDRSDETRW